ncbi:MAG: amidohydrolase family protein [Thermotogae bacterium]|nr:amidohydrolase family protein [Thermotogota bacterium]
MRKVLKGLRAVFDGYSLREGVDVALEYGKIVEVGENLKGDEYIILEGEVLYPSFVDAHTHLIYAGDRVFELNMRLSGASYLDILKAGGGIYHTVKATVEASDEELLNLTLQRIKKLQGMGVGVVEIKTGYGLEYGQEIRLLKLINEVSLRTDAVVVPTLLFHVPPKDRDVFKYLEEFFLRYDEYAHLLRFVDVFADEGAYGPEETETILSFYTQRGVQCRLHADEFKPFASRLAAKYGCVSADHLIHTDGVGAEALARAKVVATLCPVTGFFLREGFAPYDLLKKRGVRIALASDHNPGTAPFLNPFLTILLAVFGYGMTPQEAFSAHTSAAADSLQLPNVGRVEPGVRGLLFTMNMTPEELIYRGEVNPKVELLRL